jgi:hypothetical protein
MAVEDDAVWSCFQTVLLTGQKGGFELRRGQTRQLIELCTIERFIGMERTQGRMHSSLVR